MAPKQEIVTEHPQHEHGTATLAGYSVVSTDWNGGSPTRYEVLRIEDPCGYAFALEAVQEVRDVSGEYQYGVIDNLYTCGCRSNRIDGTIVRQS